MQMAFPVELRRELNALREERPRLLTDETDLVHRFSRMVLRDVSGELEDIDVTAEERMHRFGIESLVLTLGRYGVAWAERIEPRLSIPLPREWAPRPAGAPASTETSSSRCRERGSWSR